LSQYSEKEKRSQRTPKKLAKKRGDGESEDFNPDI